MLAWDGSASDHILQRRHLRVREVVIRLRLLTTVTDLGLEYDFMWGSLLHNLHLRGQGRMLDFFIFPPGEWLH